MEGGQLAVIQNAVVAGNLRLTPIGLRMTGPPTYDDWLTIGEALRIAERAVQFAVGDWLNIGEGYFKELADQVIDHEHWSEESVRVYRWVADKVPPENRRPDLTFSHHQAIAALPVEQQVQWLEKAALGDASADGVIEPWSIGRLKTELRSAEEETTVPEYGLIIWFASPADRDIVHDEHQRHGRRVRKTETTRLKERP